MVSGSGGRGLLESNASSASVALGTHVVLLSFCPARRLERLLLRMRCFYFALRAHLHLLYYFNHCRNSGNNSRPTAPKQRLTRYAVINGARAIWTWCRHLFEFFSICKQPAFATRSRFRIRPLRAGAGVPNSAQHATRQESDRKPIRQTANSNA